MSVTSWGDRLSPDLTSTFRRFPLAIALQTVATGVLVAVANGWLTDASDDTWVRVMLSLGTGAVFAVAGTLFQESRRDWRVAGLAAAYMVPLLVVASFQIEDSRVFVWNLMPAVGVLWLSVAAFTDWRAAGREEQQNRFWWMNHRAFTSGVLALAGLVVVFLGSFAIEATLSALFGLQTADIFWKFIVPVTVGLLAPVYWLSTMPELGDYEVKSLEQPDFVSRAVGFLGQFILAPVLIAYAGILFAYMIQIAIARELPQGVLGWMVLGFVTTGAATWLLLYPPFMRERWVVRFFHRTWFWLTIVPLALFGLALWTRISAYGLTSQRMIVLGGGVWAIALTAAFLLRRGDIRLIPGLAAVVLLGLSVGTWNVANAPLADQAYRLDAVLTRAGVAGPKIATNWSATLANAAGEQISFLAGTEAGRGLLQDVLLQHGIDYDGQSTDVSAVLASIGSPGQAAKRQASLVVTRGADGPPTDLTSTPFYLGPLTLLNSSIEVAGRQFELGGGNMLSVFDRAGNHVIVALGAWAAEPGPTFATPSIDFDLGAIQYRIALDKMTTVGPDKSGDRRIVALVGTLFASSAAAPIAAKADSAARLKPTPASPPGPSR